MTASTYTFDKSKYPLQTSYIILILFLDLYLFQASETYIEINSI